MSLPIYIDIDGTLTTTPHDGWGEIVEERLDAVKALIEAGELVVIWSARGDEYAKEFVKKHNLKVHAALGKPKYCIDDKPTVRGGGMTVLPPTELEKKK